MGFHAEKRRLMGYWEENERNAKTERAGPYLVRDGITVTVDEMARTVDASMQGCLAASLASGLEQLPKESTTQIFLRLVGGVVAQCGEIVPET